MKIKKIMVMGSHPKSLVHFRGDFIKNLVDNGYEVFGAAPDIDDEVENKLNSLGAKTAGFELERTGLNPFMDLKSINNIKKILIDNEIDLLFPYSIKPVIYGSIAAAKLNIPVISMISGLGYTFSGASTKAKLLQKVTQTLYRKALKTNHTVIFQNRDDYQLFLDKNIIAKSKPVDFIGGSGVSLDKYRYRVNEKVTDNIKFMFVARLIKEKGIDMYVNAAEKLKGTYTNAEFHIIGEPDNTPSGISIDRINELVKKDVIVYHGRQNNVEEHLYKNDVFVLPTYYREGIPRSCLEATSVGLPLITTNTPGCKETIVGNNENGILIPPKNEKALVDAMEAFLKNPSMLKEMGIKSRQLAEEKFDVNIINAVLLKNIKKVI
ncbi:glycosyltransferase family 4 protein [Cellulophaga baltica]|uniref:glycosyltransferase family 4 protein n=1 Tax=Cellulophaga TaxID=104264 RepID=UPI001C06A009|nr:MULTISPECIES: glycosyltransferase family 4 protein [Cellulophaga]MBU2996737.1 glycosyltransferase family 4 protein [Cellulophaga baltica]MDO6768133.1 glycosyltransferase family 4 protein [Cellulophaga sp. 1_MG-2023]